MFPLRSRLAVRVWLFGHLLPSFSLFTWGTHVVAQDLARPLRLTERASVKGLGQHLLGLACSPDGATIAAAARPHSIYLLDSKTLTRKNQLEGHVGTVFLVDFTPNGKSLVSAGRDGTVRLWDLATKSERLLIKDHEGEVRGLAISPDSGKIISGDFNRPQAGAVRCWDSADGHILPIGRPLADFHGAIQGLAISPDGSKLLTGTSDGVARLWNLIGDQPPRAFETGAKAVGRVVYASDGKSVALVVFDRTVRVLDAATMNQRYQIDQQNEVLAALAVSPDGTLLATSDGDRLRLFRFADGVSLATIRVPDETITAIAFTPDGTSIIVGGTAGCVRSFQIER